MFYRRLFSAFRRNIPIPMNARIRVVLADDHPVVVAGVTAIIEESGDMEIVGTACNSSEMVALLDRYPCDVLLTDYAMPGGDYGDGIPLMGFLLGRYPLLRIVVLTMLDNGAILPRLAATGIHGLVSKADELSHIPLAIRSVERGRTYLSPLMQATLDGSRGVGGKARPALTVREEQVIRLFVSGLSVGQIAQRLERGKQTISAQKVSAMRKLGIDREADLYRYALELGWETTAEYRVANRPVMPTDH
ncbi:MULTISPECIES: response regulator transcription factor [Ralstonia]|uniref:Capsular synthesis regulator component B n=1 Tax=Ralstonia mannitolilytica TaxID=105219 RepID=A0AAJ5D4L3_9RALS|nr:MULTISPECIES: response regulator transcription factor [Ralstonia]CAG2150387.1 Transcriptional regulatory protein RcsB [Ralstonia mannitolilytica]CAJ0724492.1 Transcriptional regulatory protein RcsB [Ralstonia mannitolilytica]SUD87459.1 Capsular synthesis regulator component B [Ralstonia mannitolilytica]SUD93379.1 Capsular synthesis regulator component B [Ralstonia mannitolilytica]SUD97118.1 Capsular synthesis regulator component B [Ralstonia mannitolilytica]